MWNNLMLWELAGIFTLFLLVGFFLSSKGPSPNLTYNIKKGVGLSLNEIISNLRFVNDIVLNTLMSEVARSNSLLNLFATFFCHIDGGAFSSYSNFMLKVNNRKTRTSCKVLSKLTIKTPERRQWRLSGVFIVNFEPILYLVVVFLLLTLRW